MCGIAAIFGQINQEEARLQVKNALQSIERRGPDHEGLMPLEHAVLGHRRLSIIDTSELGNQPMVSQDGRYFLIFNGEIYNYNELRQQLTEFTFKSGSDTEVLLYLLVKFGSACLEKLNGFFAFAFYDSQTGEVLVARDRYGIKPLFFSVQDKKLLVSSSLNSMFDLGVSKEIDYDALAAYLHLNYVPAPYSMLKQVKKLMPGRYLTYQVHTGAQENNSYYQVKLDADSYKQDSYTGLQRELVELMHSSVKYRMIADVPLGGFLSGGVDSSVICSIAKQYDANFNTFSIGYKNNSQYDESHYADAVAEKLKTNHHAFMLEKADLLHGLDAIFEVMDEPFADSSAIPLYLLCEEAVKKVKVALSGDGADEIFSGYNKHKAEYFIRNRRVGAHLIKLVSGLTSKLPQSRESIWSNRFRQITRFGYGVGLSPSERYWNWAGYYPERDVSELLRRPAKAKGELIHELIHDNLTKRDFNQVLLQDVHLVLTNDMLVKADTMSMANSLEVRVPFLDYRVVDFAFNLDAKYKIDSKMKKKILQDAFRSELPEMVYNRPKHGFEVPMLAWLQHECKDKIERYLSSSFIEEQKIFNYAEIEKEKNRLFSTSPGEAHARIWCLLLFQIWWERYLGD
jgi:asparagine synthase (glutamine-hydrolysing)